MLSTGGFDVMLQFKQDIINDILIRVLNESLLTNLQLKSPVSRLIEQPIPTAEVKAYWDKPDLALSDDNTISLSVEVNGGARQLITQRILTISGSISMTRKALLVEASDGTFYLCLESPQPLDLHMSKLHATYTGSRWPEYLSAIDPTREISALRPVLTYELMYPLANLPLSYDVRSLPLRFAPSNSFRPTSSPAWIIPVRAADTHLVKTTETEAVAIGVSLTNVSYDASSITGAFPKGVESNASITLTSSGMNFVLEQLQRQDALAGIIQSTSKAQEVSWRWESLTVAFHQDYISLAGNLRMNESVTHVTADLYCFVDQYGYLTITPRAITTDTSIAETIMASWSAVLRMILRARDKNQRDDDRNDQYKLFQCFAIPGTPVAVEAVADALLIEEGALTLFYDIPKESAGFHAEIPLHKPKVTITQPRIPVQMAKGAPVSIEMQAQLTAQSYPPYDYAWTTDLSQGPTPARGPSMTVTGLPTTPATDNGLQVLTNTHVKVIDMFGQDVDASAPARYQPWSHQRRRLPDHPHRLASTLLIIAVAIVVIVTSGIGAALAILLPSLSLSGSSSVFSGGTMLLHGRNFVPGSSVTLTLDNGLPLTYVGRGPAEEALHEAGSVTALQLSVVGQLAQSSSASTPIPVNGLGQFDVSIRVSESWSLGVHTIHALDSILGRSAELSFTVIPKQSLEVRPSNFNVPGDPNCSYNAHAGWTCTTTLSSPKSAQANLNWTASSSGVSGVTFSQSSGILTPGQSARITITIPNTACPAQADFTFKGPANAVNVLWRCAAPTLTANPATLSTACLSCSVTLALALGSQGGLSWSASANGINGANFAPPNGTLLVGQTTQVTITVPNSTCPPSADFAFAGPANTAHVTWRCVPPKLAVSPGQFVRTDCSYTGKGWNCAATLTNLDTQRGLKWSSSTSGISGITFSPSSSVIPAGQSTPVTIFVPNTTCPASAHLIFTGPLNTVDVAWQCQPPGIQVSPPNFNANTDCSYIAGKGWTCQATVTDADSQLSAGWSASTRGVTFAPASGTVSPGQLQQVAISVPDMTCPNKIAFTFTGPANTVTVSWSCGAPALTVTPLSIYGNKDCSYGANNGWACSATLSSSSNNQGKLNWSASSSGLSGISFSQPNGTLSPGQSQPFEIFVSAVTICPVTANLIFSGPSNTVTVPWICAAPTLKVSPTSLGLKNCQSVQGTWTCKVTLSDDQGGANWSASSDFNGVIFSPASGSVYPSRLTVTISNIPCGNGNFYFKGPANIATVSLQCVG